MNPALNAAWAALNASNQALNASNRAMANGGDQEISCVTFIVILCLLASAFGLFIFIILRDSSK